MSPVAPLRPCAEPRCHALVKAGRCAVHAQGQERQRANYDVRRWYRAARWAAYRRQKFRDDPVCVDCRAEGVLVTWTDLDHAVPHRGDPDTFWNFDNLVGRCHRHHSMKTGRGE